ncbi:MAG: alanine racemase [Deltaproteobacteria bacterium]|nr:alanine racemase [Deltaproteobacteria bacterium]
MTTLDARLAGLALPYYLVDRAALRARIRDMRGAFERRFRKLAVAYSYKTNYFPSVLRTVHAEGAWAEVVSELEYALALRLRVPTNRIVFNGPIKSDAALERALAGGSLVHIDGLEEAERIAAIVRRHPAADPRVGLRVNLPHPEGEGHRAFSRFGLPLEALDRAVAILADAGVEVTGLHAHLATKQRSAAHFEGVATALGEAAKLVGIDRLSSIDVGGGFGFSPAGGAGRAYPSFDEYADVIHGALARSSPALVEKRLLVEPGMAMVNDVVRFVTRVEAVKQIGGRTIAVVDGSIQTVKPTRHGLNLPTRVYDAEGRPKSGPSTTCDLVGYTCMDDDYIAIDQALPHLERGDRVEIDHVGAYTAVFKPTFIRAMPAVHSIDGNRLELDLPEQRFEDFFAGFRFEEEAP